MELSTVDLRQLHTVLASVHLHNEVGSHNVDE